MNTVWTMAFLASAYVFTLGGISGGVGVTNGGTDDGIDGIDDTTPPIDAMGGVDDDTYDYLGIVVGVLW